MFVCFLLECVCICVCIQWCLCVCDCTYNRIYRITNKHKLPTKIQQTQPRNCVTTTHRLLIIINEHLFTHILCGREGNIYLRVCILTICRSYSESPLSTLLLFCFSVPLIISYGDSRPADTHQDISSSIEEGTISMVS